MPRLRTKKFTRTLPNGVKVIETKLVKAPELEWKLQAEAVRQLKQMPEFDKEFTIAADMNSARRSSQESIKAKATGIAAGDPDLRLYGKYGRLLLIEYKAKNGRLEESQKVRHPLLASLGHPVFIIKSNTPDDCAAQTLSLVKGWLSASNDNAPVKLTA
jgi:hypothetical protein